MMSLPNSGPSINMDGWVEDKKRNISLEPGEITDALPYKRPARKRGGASECKLSHVEKVVARKIDDPRRLVLIKRVLDSFNSGNIEWMKDIIFETVPTNCNVYIASLNLRLIGAAPVFMMLTSLFESFPNGLFRISDTTIDDEGKVVTRFAFTGTRLYNFLFAKQLPQFGEPSPAIPYNNSLSRNSSSNNSSGGSSSGGSSGSLSESHPTVSASGKENGIRNYNSNANQERSTQNETKSNEYAVSPPATGNPGVAGTPSDEPFLTVIPPLSSTSPTLSSSSRDSVSTSPPPRPLSSSSIDPPELHQSMPSFNMVVSIDKLRPLLTSSRLLREKSIESRAEGVVKLHLDQECRIANIEVYWVLYDSV